MQSTRTRLKSLLLLLVAQVGCFALGLLGYGHFVSWSSQHAAQELTWPRLIQQADAPRSDTGVIVVDDQWRVVSASTPPGDKEQPLPVGQPVLWSPVDDPAEHANLIRGMVELAGDQLAGLAVRRATGGYNVLYVPNAALSVPVSEISSGMQVAGLITLFWVSGVLGLIVYLIITRLYDDQSRGRAQWEAQSLGQIQALQRTRDGIVFGLAKLAEFRDQETGYHLERISAFATQLAGALARRVEYRDRVNAEFVHMIGVSAVLHDIGKVGVPDAILLKPGPLTAEERKIMQRHTLIGNRCIAEIERRLGNSNFLRMAGEIALSHHERWNGAGYPHGLAGEKIPLAARIVAMVDVYDALSSRRVYKAPLTHEECLDVIRKESGRHFDPILVEVFLQIEDEIRTIAARYVVETPLPAPSKPLPRWNLARENEELAATCEIRDEELWSEPLEMAAV